jgi:ABC-type multidrug transport system ATPase subunit/ABC-type multidrug transport system permease subunit
MTGHPANTTEEKGATSKALVGLTWSGLSYSIGDKKAPDGKKWILHPQDGQVCPKDLIALMGPSGSGKTSVLNALAGRLPITRGASFHGSLEVNGVPKSKLPCAFADISAYVEQEDCLYALSTVQETTEFAARLRLPKGFSAQERNARIEEVLRQLGLLHVRHTNVGGSSFNGAVRGLSGGERKRLSIAIELLHQPRVIFLDEPTTGLDSYQALNVMQKLRALADEGHTVVVSIHQPRSSIFAMLTGIYLLANGKPIYAGPASRAVSYFGDLGYQLPEKFNPADFFIDLVSVDQRDVEEQARTEKQVADLQATWQGVGRGQEEGTSEAPREANRESILAAKSEKPAGQTTFLGPFFLLLIRNFREQARDSLTLAIKTVFTCVFTVIFALVYFQLGHSQRNIQDRIGLLFFLSMNQAFGAVIGCAQTIPRQLIVVNRERANRLYNIIPFYISSLTVMVPVESLPLMLNNAILFFMVNLSGSFWVFFGILSLENIVGISLGMMLSACFKNVQMASQLAPAVVILFLTFSGFLINEDSVPVYFIWLREMSFIRYTFKALVVNEFDGATFECDAASAAPCVTNGEQMLAQLGFDEKDLVETCAIILVAIALIANFLAILILFCRRPRFLALKEAPGTLEPPKESVGKGP